MMLEGEKAASREKQEAAGKARDCDIDHAHDFFEESSRDKLGHAMDA